MIVDWLYCSEIKITTRHSSPLITYNLLLFQHITLITFGYQHSNSDQSSVPTFMSGSVHLLCYYETSVLRAKANSILLIVYISLLTSHILHRTPYHLSPITYNS